MVRTLAGRTPFLDGSSDEAISELERLRLSRDRSVAVAALLALGEWHEFSGAHGLARGAYEEAVQLQGLSATLAATTLARLHNEAHEPALAMAVLEHAVTQIDSAPADLVQFVVIEYIRAVRDLGRIADARAFVDRVTRLFPDRSEIPVIERHLLVTPR